MSYRVGTPNYNLPQTEGTDKRDWSDTNQAFLAIDTAIKSAVDNSSSASSAAATAQTTADSATTTATHAQTDASAALTLATTANEQATVAKNRADSAYALANTANTNAKAGGIGQNSYTRVNGSGGTLTSMLTTLFNNADKSKIVVGRSFIHMHRSTEDRAFHIGQVASDRIDAGLIMVNDAIALLLTGSSSTVMAQLWSGSPVTKTTYNPTMPSGSYIELIY